MASSYQGLVFWIAVLAAYMVWRFVRDRAKLKRGERLSALHEAGCLLFALYLAELAAVSFLPIDPSLAKGGASGFTVVLAPLGTMAARTAEFGSSLVGRVVGAVVSMLWYVPLGLMIPLVAPKLAAFRRTLPAGVAAGLAIEALQLLEGLAGVSGQLVSTDDVILVTLGTVAGYGVFMLVRGVVRRYDPDFRREAQLGLEDGELDAAMAQLDEDDAVEVDGAGDTTDSDAPDAPYASEDSKEAVPKDVDSKDTDPKDT